MSAFQTLLPVAALFTLTLSACSSQPDNRAREDDPATVSRVDLERYAGRWYEIARYPNSFEDKEAYRCVGVTADYALRDDGKIDVTNTCRENTLDGPVNAAEGVARVVGGKGAKLKVRFAPAYIPFAEGDYWILDLTDDYSAALVGDPAGKFLWILSRTPQISEGIKARFLSAAKTRGYATDPLIYPEQFDAPVPSP